MTSAKRTLRYAAAIALLGWTVEIVWRRLALDQSAPQFPALAVFTLVLLNGVVIARLLTRTANKVG